MKIISKYKNIFFEYLYETLTDKKGSLSLESTTRVLLMAIHDYFDKQINTHVLSSISTTLYFDFNKPSNFEANNLYSEVGSLLNMLSEIEYYEKNDKLKAEKIFSDARDFWLRHKNILSDGRNS